MPWTARDPWAVAAHPYEPHYLRAATRRARWGARTDWRNRTPDVGASTSSSPDSQATRHPPPCSLTTSRKLGTTNMNAITETTTAMAPARWLHKADRDDRLRLDRRRNAAADRAAHRHRPKQSRRYARGGIMAVDLPKFITTAVELMNSGLHFLIGRQVSSFPLLLRSLLRVGGLVGTRPRRARWLSKDKSRSWNSAWL
jgi:hypothetical protein